MHEYDSGLAIMHIEDAKKLFKYGNAVGALQIKLDDMFLVGQVKKDLAHIAQKTLYIRDWTQQHANFFRAIEMEKKMMFIVLALIIMVATFNVVSTMVMVVTDKQGDIAVLRTIGATPGRMQLIFIIQGLVNGTLGALYLLTGGVSFPANIHSSVSSFDSLLGSHSFPSVVYYISNVPSKVQWSE